MVIICGAQYKKKTQAPCSKTTKNFNTATAEHETKSRALLSVGLCICSDHTLVQLSLSKSAGIIQ